MPPHGSQVLVTRSSSPSPSKSSITAPPARSTTATPSSGARSRQRGKGAAGASAAAGSRISSGTPAGQSPETIRARLSSHSVCSARGCSRAIARKVSPALRASCGRRWMPPSRIGRMQLSAVWLAMQF